MSDKQVCRRASVAELKRAFSYDPKTGIVRWKINPGYKWFIGEVVGHKDTSGSLRVGFKGRTYSVTTIAFAIYYGRYPRVIVDHKNRIKHDNRITNLREATLLQNNWNAASKISKSGFRGVTLVGGRFVARIRHGGKSLPLGSYGDGLSAAKQYDKAALRLRGEFALINGV